MGYFSQNIWHPTQDQNWMPPEYKFHTVLIEVAFFVQTKEPLSVPLRDTMKHGFTEYVPCELQEFWKHIYIYTNTANLIQ
jgi:hypothetical protein